MHRPPYGVSLSPEHAEHQTFRQAGDYRVRSFMPPLNRQDIAHGKSSVLTAHAFTLAKAARLFDRQDWAQLAERQIQWTADHNSVNRSLYNGIGHRQPVGYGFRVPSVPEGTLIGFIGRPDDSPYVEESFAIEWNTLEFWDVPYAHLANAIVEIQDK